MNPYDNSSYSYIGEDNNPTGFTNNWLESRKNIHLFDQNYDDFPLYAENTKSGNTSYRDILGAQLQRSELSDMFFGNSNLQHLKRLICDQVYQKSGGKYKITPQSQSDNDLLMVMKPIYLDNAKHLPEDIRSQVAELNYMVLLQMVTRVMNNVQLNLTYQRDHSQQHLTMDRPMWTSSAGTKSNQSVTDRFI